MWLKSKVLSPKHSRFIRFCIKRFKQYSKYFIRGVLDFSSIFLSLPSYPRKIYRKNKSILILNWRDTKHSYAGGAEVYIYELAKRWVKKGHRVTLFCGNDGLSPTYELVEGIEVIRRGGFYFVYLWAFLYYILKLRNSFDIILDCQNGIPFFTPLYAKQKVYCLMFHVHQDVFRRSLIKPLAYIASILEKKIMPWVYQDIKFITISNSSKKDMQSLGLGKKGIAVINPGVDLERFFPRKKTIKPLVLYVGRLKFYKSVHHFIEIAQRIIANIPSARFVIAGDGEEKKGLIKMIKRLRLEKYIQLRGRVSEDEKIRLYQRAWACINPSMMEGWGITTIEANACATPVIASDVSGLKDSVIDGVNGFLVPYGNIDIFVSTLKKLLNNKALLRKMSDNSYRVAQKYSWEKSAEKGLTLLK